MSSSPSSQASLAAYTTGASGGDGGWQSRSLSSLAKFVNGYSFHSSQSGLHGAAHHSHPGPHGIRMRTRTISPVSCLIDTSQGRGTSWCSASGSLDVFTWDGPEAWVNQHIFRVTDIADDIEPRFLYYVLLHKIQAIRRMTHGSTMKHITRKQFLDVEVPVPPLGKQIEIAKSLDAVRRAQLATRAVAYAARALADSVREHLIHPEGPPSGRVAQRRALSGDSD